MNKVISERRLVKLSSERQLMKYESPSMFHFRYYLKIKDEIVVNLKTSQYMELTGGDLFMTRYDLILNKQERENKWIMQMFFFTSLFCHLDSK